MTTITWLPIAISVFAVIVSIVALYLSYSHNNKTLRLQILKDILDEFKSEQMGSYGAELWKFYHDAGKNEKKLVENYLCEYERKGHEPGSLHLKRRYVSHYYQQVALYYYGGFIQKNDLKKFWGESSVSIIKKIIHPIEVYALNSILEKKDEPKPEKIEMMFRLHDELNNNDKINFKTGK